MFQAAGAAFPWHRLPETASPFPIEVPAPMKAHYPLAMELAIAFSLSALPLQAQTLLSEDFEDSPVVNEIGPLSDGWTMYGDNLTNMSGFTQFGSGWVVSQVETHNKAAASVSGNTTGASCDRWLVTPAVTLPDGTLRVSVYGEFLSDMQIDNPRLALYLCEDSVIGLQSNGYITDDPGQPVGIAAAGMPTVAIYPNPAADMLHVTAGATILSLTVSTVDGRRVMDFGRFSADIVDLDISSLAAGLYIDTVATPTSVASSKVVVR